MDNVFIERLWRGTQIRMRLSERFRNRVGSPGNQGIGNIGDRLYTTARDLTRLLHAEGPTPEEVYTRLEISTF